MKKKLGIMLVILLLFQNVIVASAADEKQIVTRSIYISFSGGTSAKVIVEDGVTMISLDSLLWYLGTSSASVKDGAHTFNNRENSITVTVYENSNQATVAGDNVTMPVATYSYAGTFYVPLTFVCESLGYFVYWHQPTQRIYIQSEEYFSQALEILYMSVEAATNQKTLQTNINSSMDYSYFGDKYIFEMVGSRYTDFDKYIAYRTSNMTVKYDQYGWGREEILETSKAEDYITQNGLFESRNGAAFVRNPYVNELLSIADEASYTALTDLDLFLYSAHVSKTENGDYVVKATADAGQSMKYSFDLFMAEFSDSLTWTSSTQEIVYDQNTYLPKSITYRYYANFNPDPTYNETVRLSLEYEYVFLFGADFTLTLPQGVN